MWYDQRLSRSRLVRRHTPSYPPSRAPRSYTGPSRLSQCVAMPVNLKARELFDTGVVGPEALKVIAQAFDEAWASIAGYFDESPATVEAALLAKAILAEANAHHDVEALKNAALQAMALAYRRRYEHGA
jgi:hypothetical protein